jgi:hypothetical protein
VHTDVFGGLNITPDTQKSHLATIGCCLTPQLIKLQADIEQTCFKPAAIDDMQGVADVAKNMPIIAINPNSPLLPFSVLDRNVTDVVH